MIRGNVNAVFLKKKCRLHAGSEHEHNDSLTPRLEKETMSKRSILSLTLSAMVIVGLVGCASAEPTKSPEAAAKVYEGLPESVKSAGVLMVGGPVQAPPYIYEDEGGKIVGLTPDLLAAVGGALGVEVKWMDTPYASAVASLKSGRIDLFTGSFIDNLEREKEVDFVDYYYLDIVTVTQKGNPKGLTGLAGLCGYTVATVKKANEECVAAGKPEIVLNELPSNAEVKIQVESNRADVMFDNLAQAEWMAAQGIPFERFGEPVSHSYAGAAFEKSNAELKDSLMYAFKKIMDSGEYDEIMSEWGTKGLAMDAPIYNGASTAPLD